MADVVELDALTGEVTERDFTPQEVAKRDADVAEHAAHQVILDALDTNRATNRATLTQQAATALQANRDFLALAAPTQAQTLAQVKMLTRESTALIRLVAGLLDATD